MSRSENTNTTHNSIRYMAAILHLTPAEIVVSLDIPLSAVQQALQPNAMPQATHTPHADHNGQLQISILPLFCLWPALVSHCG